MVDKNAVRRSYDELADAYAERRSEGGPETKILARFLESLPESARVLDAGCGQGAPVLTRAAASGTAVGLDFSREQLRLAAANAPDAALVRGDMTALPFATGAFDGVVACWSLIHVPMDDHRTVVEEFARVLRPGGRVLLCEGTNEWVGENPDWLETGIEMAWNVAGAEATRKQLRAAGFALEGRWGVPEDLGAGEGEREVDLDELRDDEDRPWTFFAARLEA